MFSAPRKGRSPCYASLRAHENVEHSQRRENVTYRDRSRIVELLLQLENKQQIIQHNVETQHNRMYSLYIGSLCNVAFLGNGTLYLHRDFTGVRGNLNAMKHSIELCLLYGQKTFVNSVQL